MTTRPTRRRLGAIVVLGVAVLVATATVFFTNGGPGLGLMYLVTGLIAAVGLVTAGCGSRRDTP